MKIRNNKRLTASTILFPVEYLTYITTLLYVEVTPDRYLCFLVGFLRLWIDLLYTKEVRKTLLWVQSTCEYETGCHKQYSDRIMVQNRKESFRRQLQIKDDEKRNFVHDLLFKLSAAQQDVDLGVDFYTITDNLCSPSEDLRQIPAAPAGYGKHFGKLGDLFDLASGSEFQKQFLQRDPVFDSFSNPFHLSCDRSLFTELELHFPHAFNKGIFSRIARFQCSNDFCKCSGRRRRTLLRSAKTLHGN